MNQTTTKSTNGRKWQIAAIALVVLVTSAVLLRHPEVIIPHAVIVLDISDSIRLNCDCLKAQVAQWLDTEKLNPHSTITLIVTGDKFTADEPRLIGQYQAPVNQRVIDGRQKAKQARDDLLHTMKSECGKLQPTDRTPLHLAIKRSLEHLQGKGCGPRSNCQLRVISDGKEEAENAIRLAIIGKTSKEPLPGKLANEDIKITFVGLAETKGSTTSRRNSQRADRLQQAWQGAFTHPDRVSFEPHCAEVQSASNPMSTR